MFIFLQLGTPSQMRRKEQDVSVYVGLEQKMSDYSTHDCHTMLSLFLAITIRAINHPSMRMEITRMCHFFNATSKKVIDITELDEIHKEM
jgi:hypothetical protein